MRVLEFLANPVGWKNPGSIGGGEIRNVEVLNRWSKWGVAVETIEFSPFPSVVYKANYKIHKVSLQAGKGETLTVLVNGTTWFLKVFYTILKWKIAKKKFDVIIASNGNLSDVIPTYWCSLFFKVPFVVVVQTTHFSDSLKRMFEKLRNEGNGVADSLLRAFTSSVTLRVMRNATALICLSEFIRDTLKQAGLNKINFYVTGMGLDLKMIETVQPLEIRYDAVFMGRVEKSKGIFDLLKAWKLLIEEKNDAKLAVVGSGNGLKKAMELVTKANLARNVNFKGFVSSPRKYAYLKSGRLFVFPSRASEGLPLAVIEALASALPVVCYDNPALTSTFHNYESIIFTPTSDIKKLAITILQVLNDQISLKRYSEISKAWARLHDWNVIAERELKIVASVAGISTIQGKDIEPN